MTNPIRLTIVMTHPVQYFAPWFRYISSQCPEIDLRVLYATQPTPEQQGVSFGRAFVWDVPLLEGYKYRVVRPPNPAHEIHSGSFRGLDVPEISVAIQESNPDVVLLSGWYSITLIRALWYCIRNRIPVLYRGDSNLSDRRTGVMRWIWILRTWLLLRLFSAYLCVGKRASEYLTWFGIPSWRIFSSPHCVDNEFFADLAAPFQTSTGRADARNRFNLNQKDFVVLYVGKLEPKKRPLDLIQAAKNLGQQTSLLLVGTGELEKECLEASKTHNVKVSLVGFLNQTELGLAYAVADCLVLPSAWGETWGLVVNEAMATGLPCVVSDRVGCAPDLVFPNLTGEVFVATDVTSLANALRRVFERSEIGHDWRNACQSRISKYSFGNAAAGLVSACRSVKSVRT